jgi:molybdate transport system regulatory protein
MVSRNPAPELQLRIRISRGGAIVMGPGRADLLAHIQATGSIAAAGRQMGMSYKRAWALVEAMNTSFADPLVTPTKGGAGGGGAKLTPLGLDLLNAYRTLETSSRQSAEPALTAFEAALAVSPSPKTG